MASTNT